VAIVASTIAILRICCFTARPSPSCPDGHGLSGRFCEE
jgi:hypothetical protein